MLDDLRKELKAWAKEDPGEFMVVLFILTLAGIFVLGVLLVFAWVTKGLFLIPVVLAISMVISVYMWVNSE